MAKNNDNGLYLPLKVDLAAWEQSLLQADADLQKEMRKMRSEMSNVKLKYDVEIANARNAGNEIKALELETQKLNVIYKAQKQAVDALNKAYQQSVKEKGADAQASKALANQLIRESKALERTKRELESKGLNFGASLADSMARISPTFAQVRMTMSEITKNMGSMGSVASSAAIALGKLGLAVAAVGAAYKGAKSLIDDYKSLAMTAAQANEEVYQLREELDSSYKDAELLAGAARIDGTNVQELSASLNKLHKQLDKTGDATSNAQKWLEKYGVSLRNGDGTRKSVIEQMKELQRAFLQAEAEGNGRDFISNTLGNASDKFLHFVRGFDDYIERASKYRAEMEKDYDAAHKLMDLQKERAEVERQLASVKGDAALSGANEIMEIEISALKEQYDWYTKLNPVVKEYGDNMVILAENTAAMANEWDAFVTEAKGAAMSGLNEGLNFLNWMKEANEALNEFLGLKKDAFDVNSERLTNINTRKQNIANIKDQRIEENEIAEMEKAETKRKALIEKRNREEIAEKEKTEKKKAEIEEKYQKALRDITANEYQRQINAIEDKKHANLDAGMSEVQAEKLFMLEKEKIDKQYFEKLQKQREADAKKAEETQKKQAENAKSEAEKILTSQKDLWKAFMKYGDTGRFQEEALKIKLKQSGISEKEYSAMNSQSLDQFKHAMQTFSEGTWLKKLNDFVPFLSEIQTTQTPVNKAQEQAQTAGKTVQNTINVTIDRPVLTDESLINQLTDRVAEKITVVAENVFGAKAQNGF